MRFRIVSTLLSALLVTSCGGDGGGEKTGDPSTPSQPPTASPLQVSSKLADGVKTVPSDQVVGASEDGSTVTVKSGTSLQPGDVFLANGLAHKAVSTTPQSDGSLLVTTSQPVLEEVFAELSISGEVTLGQSDVVSGPPSEVPRTIQSAETSPRKPEAIDLTVTNSTDTDGTQGIKAKLNLSQSVGAGKLSVTGAVEAYDGRVKIAASCAPCKSGAATVSQRTAFRFVADVNAKVETSGTSALGSIDTPLARFYVSLPQIAFIVGVYVPVSLRTEVNASVAICGAYKGRTQFVVDDSSDNPSTDGSAVALEKASDPPPPTTTIVGDASLGVYIVGKPRILAAGIPLTALEAKVGADFGLKTSDGSNSKCLTATAKKAALIQASFNPTLTKRTYMLDLVDLLKIDRDLFPAVSLTPNCDTLPDAPYGNLDGLTGTCTILSTTPTSVGYSYQARLDVVANVSGMLVGGLGSFQGQATNQNCGSWDSTLNAPACTRTSATPSSTSITAQYQVTGVVPFSSPGHTVSFGRVAPDNALPAGSPEAVSDIIRIQCVQ